MSDKPVIEEVTLENPIKRGETSIEKVKVRKPRASELRGLTLQALGQSDVSALLTVIPRITDPILSQAEADALEPEDLAAFGEKIFGFFLTSAEKAKMATLLGT